MPDLLPAAALPEIAERLEEIKWRREYMIHQIKQRMIHPMGVPVFLQHVLYPLNSDDICKGHEIIAEHFIRCSVHVQIAPLVRIPSQTRSSQHLQKAELQLLRTKLKYVIEGSAKRIVVLQRKSGDQIKMLINFARILHLRHGTYELGPILPALNGLVGWIIG
ncbi:hypothetical protein D3C80_1512610 [compost metagenome]